MYIGAILTIAAVLVLGTVFAEQVYARGGGSSGGGGG